MTDVEQFTIINRNTFVVVPIELIEDARLSAGAVRIYCYMRSKTGVWKFYNSDIMQKLNIKNTHTIAKKLKELLSAGWIRRNKIKDSSGVFAGYQYEIYESLKCECEKQAEILDLEQSNLPANDHMPKNSNLPANDHMPKNSILSSCNKDNINIKKEKYKKEKEEGFELSCEPPEKLIGQIDVGFMQGDVIDLCFIRFLDYRRRMKKPFKIQKSVELLHKRFRSWCNGSESKAKAIVERTISNQWQGLFDLQENKFGGKKFLCNSSSEYDNIGVRG